MPPLFPLGRILMTTNLQGRIQESDPEHWEEELRALVDRHVLGDWGDLDHEDKKRNDQALRSGGRLFSSYSLGDIKLYIITEADRSLTTALLPEDY